MSARSERRRRQGRKQSFSGILQRPVIIARVSGEKRSEVLGSRRPSADEFIADASGAAVGLGAVTTVTPMLWIRVEQAFTNRRELQWNSPRGKDRY